MAPSLTPEFVFSDKAKKGGKPKSIEAVAPIQGYIVSFRDGKGDLQTRLAFVPEGHDMSFILQGKITGTPVATSANKWFNTALRGHLAKSGAVQANPADTAESI